ncbi:sugar ABC transporter substrate-binding protein [Paramaledivibacter caminithermalis]|uniref:Simple sugar transport system substrate-binding protein n=1 Tax=Paramaledivibacter caminithermalis (strain DSM 15212 / CIP 107654 / DViRD3) TaxID=1121301 RepID=A0A1M6P5A7_PARC5|nr:sugar ABC transporter substrate-binding protein [Paramaledivibacter caminithermalis]SHK03118.1 simple sugar transport system substrate-binding protein [Paramaledivibacter caminithermalis DSM 15212]
MKKFFALLLAVLLIFSVVGCSSQPKESAPEKAEPAATESSEPAKASEATSGNIPAALQGKTIKMALIKEWGTGTHMITHINGVKAEAARYGIELSVIDANNDLTKMAEGIDNAVTNKMDAILISHGKADALTDSVTNALKAGIPVIVFDNDFDVPEEIHKGKLVSLDQYDLMMGLLSQMSLVQELDGKGKVVYNRVANVPPTDKRHRIWEGGILPTYTGIEVINTIDLGTDNPMPKAQTALETILTTTDKIDAVYGVWDEYAKGFYNAIVASGKKIPLYSVDISDQDLAMMQDHPEIWRSSAAVDPTVVGQVQVRLALKALAGEKIPRYYSLKPVLIHVDDLPSKDERRVTMADLAEFYDGWGSTTDFLEDWMLEMEKQQK